MKFNRIASGCLIFSMGLAPAEQAAARGRDLIGGLIVGGIIGAAIANDAQRTRKAQAPRRSSKPAKPSMSAEQREANKEVQTALNYFNFPVGTPDGSIGPKSRAAISEYQVSLGYPATGQLTEYERTLLVSAYHRAVAGGAVIAQKVASDPAGVRSILILQRDEMAGVAPAGEAVEAAAAAATLPALVEEPAAGTALPSFMASGATMASLASTCNKVSLLTNTNGGYTTAAAMSDANFALAEQFCLARTYAMATGEEMAAKVAGFTPAQIAEQCQAFGPVLKDQVAALSMKPAEDVLQGVSGFVMSSGMSPTQLSGTAKICLGVGYTTDAMDVAVASALILTALGEKGYGELLGHHLSQGFGATVRPDLALGWYDMGLQATQAGAGVFAPGLPDRTELIRKAAYTIGGRTDLLPEAPAALPVLVAEPEVQEAAVAPEAVVIDSGTASKSKDAAKLQAEVAVADPAPTTGSATAEPEAMALVANPAAAGRLSGASVISVVGQLFGN